MKKQTEKTNSVKCGFCSPESSPELCNLSTAKTIIDGKEYSACCIKCAGTNAEEKPEKSKTKQTKK
jgi:hypothetical protein